MVRTWRGAAVCCAPRRASRWAAFPRISIISRLKQPVEQGMGPGTGFWGFYEAESADVGNALLIEAEKWLRAKGMTRMLGPGQLCDVG